MTGGLAALALPFLLAAQCEGRYVSMGSDAGTSGDSESRAGATFGGAGGSGPGTAGSTQGGAGPAPQCEEFLDAEATTRMIVRITNATDEPIHLGQTQFDCSGLQPYFTVSDDSGAVRGTGRPHCDTACALQQSTQIVGCTANCPWKPLVRLAPGASYEVPWDARFLEHLLMPASCHSRAETATQQCSRLVPAPVGSYVFKSVAWSEMVCQTPGACQCGEDVPACELPGQVVTGETREATALVELPTEDVVELRFE